MNNYNYVRDKCLYPTLADIVTELNGHTNGLTFGLKAVVINGRTEEDDYYDIYWMAMVEKVEGTKYVEFEDEPAFENTRELVDEMSLEVTDIPLGTVFYRKYFPYHYLEDENVGAKIKPINWVLTEQTAVLLALAQELEIDDKEITVDLQALYKDRHADAFVCHAWHVSTEDDFRIIPVQSRFTPFIEEFGDVNLSGDPLEVEDTLVENEIELKLWKSKEGLRLIQVE